MLEGKRVVAIIPARGGSKGLPGKNIRPLGGKPLLAWSIEAALNSGVVDRVMVSSDSTEICRTARLHGAEVPFVRPAHLATDEAKGIDVLLQAIDWLQENGEEDPLILLLQPTSPLRTAADIKSALQHYSHCGGKAIVSVCKVDHHPWWSNTLPANGNMGNFLRQEVLNANRQELPSYFRLNGAIYLGEIDYLRRHGSFLGPETFAYEMPVERSVDIDNLFDFRVAEMLVSTPAPEMAGCHP